MTNNSNKNQNTQNTITLPDTFLIHKKAGELKTCRFVEKPEDIPAFLTNPWVMDAEGNLAKVEPAVTVLENGNVRMIAVEGPAERQFPFFLKWEKTAKLACGYGSWPKDNGWDTLDVINGRCYDKAASDDEMPRYLACRLVCPVPLHFGLKKSLSIRNNHVWVKTNWGEEREHQIPKYNHCEAVLVEYEDGGINILTLSEESAFEYYVEIDGHDVGLLVDLI